MSHKAGEAKAVIPNRKTLWISAAAVAVIPIALAIRWMAVNFPETFTAAPTRATTLQLPQPPKPQIPEITLKCGEGYHHLPATKELILIVPSCEEGWTERASWERSAPTPLVDPEVAIKMELVFENGRTEVLDDNPTLLTSRPGYTGVRFYNPRENPIRVKVKFYGLVCVSGHTRAFSFSKNRGAEKTTL